MTNWKRHQERISKAKFAREFTAMVTDLYGDFQEYCLKSGNNCKEKCYKCYLEWLDKEVEEKND